MKLCIPHRVERSFRSVSASGSFAQLSDGSPHLRGRFCFAAVRADLPRAC